VEPIQEVAQVFGPTGDVLVRIVEVTHAMPDAVSGINGTSPTAPAFETTV
jgi:hypothetical protein